MNVKAISRPSSHLSDQYVKACSQQLAGGIKSAPVLAIHIATSGLKLYVCVEGVPDDKAPRCVPMRLHFIALTCGILILAVQSHQAPSRHKGGSTPSADKQNGIHIRAVLDSHSHEVVATIRNMDDHDQTIWIGIQSRGEMVPSSLAVLLTSKDRKFSQDEFTSHRGAFISGVLAWECVTLKPRTSYSIHEPLHDLTNLAASESLEDVLAAGDFFIVRLWVEKSPCRNCQRRPCWTGEAVSNTVWVPVGWKRRTYEEP